MKKMPPVVSIAVSLILLAIAYSMILRTVKTFSHSKKPSSVLAEKPAPHNPDAFTGNTPLYFAARNGELEKVKKIVKEEPGLIEIPFKGNTVDGWRPLDAAINSGHLEVVRCLLEAGADITHKDKIHDFTPLMLAAFRGQTEIARLLIDKGAELNVQDKFRDRPLLIATSKGHSGVAQLLIEKGAEVNITNSGEYTPLIYGSYYCDLNVVKLLVKKGANIEARSKYGHFPLYMAVARGDSEIVRYLVANGADINKKTYKSPIKDIPQGVGKSLSMLHVAAAFGYDDIGVFLVKKGAHVNETTEEGLTPLWYASDSGCLKCAQCLIDRKADVNLCNWRGTPLLNAIYKGNLDMVKLLVSNGADVNLKSKDKVSYKKIKKRGKVRTRTIVEKGHSPLSVAKKMQKKDIEEYLTAHGAHL